MVGQLHEIWMLESTSTEQELKIQMFLACTNIMHCLIYVFFQEISELIIKDKITKKILGFLYLFISNTLKGRFTL